MEQKWTPRRRRLFAFISCLCLGLVPFAFISFCNLYDNYHEKKAEEMLNSINDAVERVVVVREGYMVTVRLQYRESTGKDDLEFAPIRRCYFDSAKLMLPKKGLFKVEDPDEKNKEVWIRAPDSPNQLLDMIEKGSVRLNSVPFTD